MSAFKDPNDKDPDDMKKLAVTIFMLMLLLLFVISDIMKIKEYQTELTQKGNTYDYRN
jgi:hypothetical protein